MEMPAILMYVLVVIICPAQHEGIYLISVDVILNSYFLSAP
jgi:hypothetical protein